MSVKFDEVDWKSRRGGMADALGSGPSSFTGVRVQLPPTAPIFSVRQRPGRSYAGMA